VLLYCIFADSILTRTWICTFLVAQLVIVAFSEKIVVIVLSLYQTL
jgi:hypothetical protein